MKRFIAGLTLALTIVAFFSCSEDNGLEALRQNELKKLNEFISLNYPDSISKSSGLYYVEEIEGHGDSLIRPGDRVQIFYATWTIDSVLIDESSGYTLGHRYDPLEYVVGTSSVITGLEEASTYMREGGKSHLVIPSELAYGQQGSSGVPGFTTLLMEVEVYKVYPYYTPVDSGE